MSLVETRWLGLVVVLLSFARPAAATPLDPFAGALPWEKLAAAHPGDWAEYAMRTGEGTTGPWLRFLVVGPAEDGSGTWLEVWISTRPGSATQAWRLLLTGDPAAPGGAARVVGRAFGGQSRELELPPPPPPSRAAAGSWTTGPEEPLQTNAGTIRARSATLHQDGTWLARSWISPAVPVFGLVRLELQGGGGIELHAFGRGGRNVVDLPTASESRPGH